MVPHPQLLSLLIARLHSGGRNRVPCVHEMAGTLAMHALHAYVRFACSFASSRPLFCSRGLQGEAFCAFCLACSTRRVLFPGPADALWFAANDVSTDASAPLIVLFSWLLCLLCLCVCVSVCVCVFRFSSSLFLLLHPCEFDCFI